MATRKDYVAIAAIVKRLRVDEANQPGTGLQVLDNLETDLCRYFKENNESFNADLFRKAAQGGK